MQPEGRIAVVGLDHVVINTLNAEALLAFYCDELGLEPVRVEEWRRGEVLFPSVRISPDTLIDLFPAERTGENMGHVCLVIAPTDLDALAARFPDAQRADGLFGAQRIRVQRLHPRSGRQHDRTQVLRRVTTTRAREGA